MNLLATHFDQHPTERQRYRNSLIGLAAGDAWGYQVEFTTFNRMPAYPVSAPKNTWRVSDDTQMAIAVNDALADLTTEDLDDLTRVDKAFIARYLDWNSDPDNDRAPGSTCKGSLRAIKSGRQWYAPNGARVSRGCGAVMRVAPAAFVDDENWAGLAALQAIITHNHPAAALSALLVADAIRHSREYAGRYITNALIAVNDIDEGTHPWCTDPFLANVLAPSLRTTSDGTSQTVQDYLLEGLHAGGRSSADETVLNALLDACDVQPGYHQVNASNLLKIDPCRRVGEGWDSPTAMALALLVADMGTSGPLTPGTALAWAATSNGDSDSIAAVSGAILGALSDQEGFWDQEGIVPTFEPRYQRAIDHAPAPSMELGVYPPEALARRAQRSALRGGPAAESAGVFMGFDIDAEAAAYFPDEDLAVDLDTDVDDVAVSEASERFYDSLDPFDEDEEPEVDDTDPACVAAAADYAQEGLPPSTIASSGVGLRWMNS